jgi:hypothetical protein
MANSVPWWDIWPKDASLPVNDANSPTLITSAPAALSPDGPPDLLQPASAAARTSAAARGQLPFRNRFAKSSFSFIMGGAAFSPPG